ncbi:MAG: hypothetical protein LQ343_003605 [Gyalolechia ehrenbergii]|nr:MAG: hypothetical protein LQ343_003605 [Gyalolechia ehrenbergii]
MLSSSRKGSTKSAPASPAPPEPPLPPAPSSSRSKKSKNVKSWGVQSSSAAESSQSHKAPRLSMAAAVPLPETPVPPKVPSQPNRLISEASLQSPKSAAGTVAKSGYFSGAELAPPASGSANLGVPEPSTPDPSAFFTPMPELPQGGNEVLPSVEVSAEAEGSSAGLPIAEKQQPVAHPEEEEEEEASTVKEIPADHVESPPPTLNILHTQVTVIHTLPAIMIGLSGSPESGKTTLAHLLSLVLPPTTPSFIIHQDDFFVRKHLLIPDTDGGVKVDYRRTVDFAAFKKLVDYSKREGRLPPGYRSLQPREEREAALLRVSPEMVDKLRADLADLPGLYDGRPVGIVDGFLLYHSSTIRNLLDMKVLLRANKEGARTRLFERFHGDHQDSEQKKHAWEAVDYFDRVVWRNYADEHAVLFEDGDVEGKPVPGICEGVEISVQPDLDMGLAEVLQWVVDVFKKGYGETRECHEREMVSDVYEYEACNCNEGFLGKIRQAIFDRM